MKKMPDVNLWSPHVYTLHTGTHTHTTHIYTTHAHPIYTHAHEPERAHITLTLLTNVSIPYTIRPLSQPQYP